jgi:hypothetical protein
LAALQNRKIILHQIRFCRQTDRRTDRQTNRLETSSNKNELRLEFSNWVEFSVFTKSPKPRTSKFKAGVP